MAKRKKSKKSKARRRSGLTVAKGKIKRRASRRSGFDRSLNTWKDALIASGLMRAGGGLIYGLMRKNKYDFPMSRVIFPSAVAVAAGQGYIPVEGVFPVAVDQAFNGLVDSTDWLRNLFDWRFLDPKPTQSAQLQAGLSAPSARELADTRLRINAVSGAQYMRGLSFDPASRSGAQTDAEYIR